MSKPTLSAYLRDHLENVNRKQEPGPFLTISRQFGCDGFELGQYLLEKLNQRDELGRWKLYYKELLKQLAEDTGLTEDVIERERRAKPSLFKDFLRGLRKGNVPDGHEIRNKIMLMVRTIAYEGYAIIIGQGSASATYDIDNGLSIRVEAPRDWRIARVSIREKIDKTAAAVKIDEIDKEREFMRRLYEEKNPREPAFAITLDNSIFKKEQMADLILLAMEQKGSLGLPKSNPRRKLPFFLQKPKVFPCPVWGACYDKSLKKRTQRNFETAESRTILWNWFNESKMQNSRPGK